MARRIGWWIEVVLLGVGLLITGGLGTAVWQGWLITDQTWLLPLNWVCVGIAGSQLVTMLAEGRKC